MRERYTKRLKF